MQPFYFYIEKEAPRRGGVRVFKIVSFYLLRAGRGRLGAIEERMTDEEEDHIATGVKRLLNDSLERADASPQPDPATLLEGVYASPEDLETPHHK